MGDFEMYRRFRSKESGEISHDFMDLCKRHKTLTLRRGFISKAVDVAEVCRKRFLKDRNIDIKDIKVDSEEFENQEGRKVNVSTIDIVLAPKN